MKSEDPDDSSDPKNELIRKNLTTPRAAAIAGILFSVLFITILVLIRLSVPADPNDRETWIPGRFEYVGSALRLMPVAGIAFLWFIGVMRDRIGVREDRFFSTVFMGSGFIFASMLFSFSAVAASFITVYGEIPERLMGSGFYPLYRALAHQYLNVYGIKMAAVFMILTSTLSIRTAIIPRWMALLGYPLALMLLLCAGFFSWFPLIFPLWVFMISVFILLTNLSGSHK